MPQTTLMVLGMPPRKPPTQALAKQGSMTLLVIADATPVFCLC
jgi:hypothetical protein